MFWIISVNIVVLVLLFIYDSKKRKKAISKIRKFYSSNMIENEKKIITKTKYCFIDDILSFVENLKPSPDDLTSFEATMGYTRGVGDVKKAINNFIAEELEE